MKAEYNYIYGSSQATRKCIRVAIRSCGGESGPSPMHKESLNCQRRDEQHKGTRENTWFI